MKVTDYQTQVVYGNVWPHDKRGSHGPHDVRLATRWLPEIVQKWTGSWVSFNVEQPNEQDNFTILRFMFLKPGTRTPGIVKGLKFRRVRQYRIRGGGLKMSIKIRYTHSLPHPMPKGRYTGTVMYDDAQKFAVVTLQAVTLRKEPEPSQPKTIITPGDPRYYESLTEAKRALL